MISVTAMRLRLLTRDQPIELEITVTVGDSCHVECSHKISFCYMFFFVFELQA